MSYLNNTFRQEQRERFGSYLQELRQRRGLKQKDVADDLGIKPENLSKIEHGYRQATDIQLARMAEIYDVSLEEILTEKHWPQLRLLSAIVKPAILPRSVEEFLQELESELNEQDREELTRYAAFLLLRRQVVYQRG